MNRQDAAGQECYTTGMFSGTRAMGWFASVGMTGCLLCGTAVAEEEAAPGGGRIDIKVPPRPEFVQRKYHVHQGFYLRGSVGVGWLGGTFDHESLPSASFSADGLNVAGDLMIGGSPSPGFAIGGALFTDTTFSARFEQNNRRVDNRNLGMYMIGPFVDGFPNPKKGWHLGGSLGWTRMTVQDKPTVPVDFDAMNAFGIAALVGHDWWAGDSFSVGTMLRGIVALGERGLTSGRTTSISLMVTGLYY